MNHILILYSSTGEQLVPPLYNTSSNNTILSFIPYIYNITSTGYPPPSLGLSSIPPLGNNWVELTSDNIICTFCENMDNNDSNCLRNEFLNPQYISIQTLYRKFHNSNCYYNLSRSCDNLC